ncbi:MAG: thioesterase family protein [Bacillota bacterium]
MADLSSIVKGMTLEMEYKVTSNDTASKFGNERVPVFASPRLLAWLEGTCIQTVKPSLPAEMDTVGTTFEFKHLAATPVGMKVTVKAELIEVEGKMLTFKVKAYDEKDKICEGTHGRAIIDLKKFLSRVEEKAKK